MKWPKQQAKLDVRSLIKESSSVWKCRGWLGRLFNAQKYKNAVSKGFYFLARIWQKATEIKMILYYCPSCAEKQFFPNLSVIV
jgi:hypothetical protein